MAHWPVTAIDWRHAPPNRNLWHDLSLTVCETDILAEIGSGGDLTQLGLRLRQDCVELPDILAGIWAKWLALNEEGNRMAVGWPRGFRH